MVKKMFIALPVSTEQACSLKIYRRHLTSFICTEDTANRTFVYEVSLAVDISLN